VSFEERITGKCTLYMNTVDLKWDSGEGKGKGILFLTKNVHPNFILIRYITIFLKFSVRKI
jgi:hypothetical protein